MKLRFSPTSPYVRKVLVAAIETGLAGEIDRVPTNPWDAETDLGESNPLGKVPTLVLDDGRALYDSPVIAEYLDTLHTGPKLFPPAGPQRFEVLRRLALADGVTDAGVLLLIETKRRPEELRWDWWIERQHAAIKRGLDQLEREAGAFAGTDIDIAQIAAACGIGWLEFRGLAPEWRTARPTLAGWYDEIMKRPSLQQTAPKEA